MFCPSWLSLVGLGGSIVLHELMDSEALILLDNDRPESVISLCWVPWGFVNYLWMLVYALLVWLSEGGVVTNWDAGHLAFMCGGTCKNVLGCTAMFCHACLCNALGNPSVSYLSLMDKIVSTGIHTHLHTNALVGRWCMSPPGRQNPGLEAFRG